MMEEMEDMNWQQKLKVKGLEEKDIEEMVNEFS